MPQSRRPNLRGRERAIRPGSGCQFAVPLRLLVSQVFPRSRTRVKVGAAAHQGCLDAGLRQSGIRECRSEVANRFGNFLAFPAPIRCDSKARIAPSSNQSFLFSRGRVPCWSGLTIALRSTQQVGIFPRQTRWAAACRTRLFSSRVSPAEAVS